MHLYWIPITFLCRQWDYFLNLAGTELPLQNLDDFSLKLANSRVNFSLFSFFEPTLKEERLKFAIKEIIQRPAASRSYKTYVADNRYNSYERTEILRPPPPYNLTIYKGWKNVILSRKFAKFALSHPIAQNLKEWTKDMEIPDEEFFPTLARITKYHQLPNGNFNITQNHQDELSLVKGKLYVYCM